MASIKKNNPDKANTLEGTILVKIIQDKSGNKRDKITEYTNNQNAVSGKDFFALQSFHRRLQKEFNEIGYYFEIQKKSSLAVNRILGKGKIARKRTYPGDKNLSYLFSKDFNNVLSVREVVQAYAAGMYFLPATASSRLGELSPGGLQYNTLFNNSTPEDPYHFLFPFAAMKYAKTSLDYNSKSNMEYKKKCLMLFVATYFQMIVSMLMKIGLYDERHNINPMDVNIDYFKTVFKNSEVNKMLLVCTDDIVKIYMRDEKVQDL